MTNAAAHAAPEHAAPDLGAKAASGYTIVSQVKSNRVVYFTDDPDYVATMDGDWYYVSSYLGSLPKGMTLRNCWRWRFNGGVFIDAGRHKPEKSARQALIDHNRQALPQILEDKIDRMRAPYAAARVMGEIARAKKLAEAQAYLNDPAQLPAYPMLEVAAVARSCSLQEAAQLIADKAVETDKVLRDTEAVRENFSHAIQQADTEEALLAIREKLLDEVFPALTQSFKFKTEHTQPPKPDEPLPATQLRHEQVRLQVQLREKINAARSAHVSQYVLDDVILKHKGRIAEILISNGGTAPDKLDIGMLEVYAKSRNLPLMDAAKEVLIELSASGKVLVETEQIKDAMLAQIASIATLRDLKRVSADIGKL